MKQKFTFIYPLFGLILFSMLFLSYSGGKDDEYAGAPNDLGTCTSCHGGGPGTGSVALSNVPNSFTAGQTYALTLTINHGSASIGGFQIVATNGVTNAMVGSFTASTGTRINNVSRLTHSFAKSFSGGKTSWTFNWTAPSSNVPPNIVFYYVGNATNANGSTDGDDVLEGIANTAIVPVELVRFDAKRNLDKTIRLEWATASEHDNQKFDIERSFNNQKFETIGQIEGSGTSNQWHNYQFTDDLTDAPTNIVYYRLRQIDSDATSTYSKIVSVALSSKAILNVYPTFARKGDILHLDRTENTTIDIVDMSGKIVKTIPKTAYTSNRDLTTETINLTTSDLPIGRYFIRASDNKLLQTVSFAVL